MTSKPNPDPAPFAGTWRTPHEVLAIDGRDAAGFLQRQCMNDVTALDADGRWQWNGLLSAKGRVLALFALLRRAPDAFWLVLGDGDAAGLGAELQRFVFRAKLTVQPQPIVAIGRIGVDTTAAAFPAPSQAIAHAGGWLLDHGSPGRPRSLWLGIDPPASAIETDTTAGSAAIWTLENIRHGLPRVPPDRRDRYTPQMLGLERLAAFSVKKGCYPGQEIVARTHFLGKAKRQLARVISPRPLLDDERISSAGGQEAQVIDHASQAGCHEGLAVLPLVTDDAAWRLDDGSALTLAPVIEGLAR